MSRLFIYHHKLNIVFRVILLFLLCITVAMLFVKETFAKVDLKEFPVVDGNKTVDVTIDFKDNTRFMGISLYPIAKLTDNRFEYIAPYDTLGLHNYYKLSREADKKDAAKVIADYIRNNKLTSESHYQIFEGKVTVQNLTPGVYLVIQDKGDSNAQLKENIIIEAPKWDEDTDDYLYSYSIESKFIPKVWFSFRPETVYPIVIVLGMILGIIMCIFGAKTFRSVFMLGASVLSGLFGMQLGQRVNSSFVGLLLFFVIFAFFGLGILMLLDAAFINPIRKSKSAPRLSRFSNYSTAILGAALFSMLLYHFITKKALSSLIIFGALSIMGLLIQYLNRDKYVIFHTYLDLIGDDLKPETIAVNENESDITMASILAMIPDEALNECYCKAEDEIPAIDNEKENKKSDSIPIMPKYILETSVVIAVVGVITKLVSHIRRGKK